MKTRLTLLLTLLALTAFSQSFIQSVAFQGAAAIQGAPVSGGAPAVIATIGVFGTNSVLLTSTGTKTTNTLANIPPESLLVLMTAHESGSDNSSTLTSSRFLSWVLRATAFTASSGPAYVWTAVDFDGGTIYVTNTVLGSCYLSSTLLAITNNVQGGGTPTLGRVATINVSAAPSTNFVVQGTNSIVCMVNSDWAEKTGAVTYRTTPKAVIADVAVTGQYRAEYWYNLTGDSNTTYTFGQSAPTGQGASFIAAEIMVPIAPTSGVATGTTLVRFEGAARGTATAALMTNSTLGTLFGGWQTYTNPNQFYEGPVPYLTITNRAYSYWPTGSTFNINGTVYGGTGTNCLRADFTSNNAVGLVLGGAGAGYSPLSVGFFFRFNGNYFDNGPRDALALRPTEQGNYAFMQLYDGASPYAHVHWLTGGTGIGNNLTIYRNQWYWGTLQYRTNGTQSLSIYDPSANWTLLGTSTGSSTATYLANKLYFGSINYLAAGQTVDYDNIIINTNGVFPLKPF